MVIQNILVVNIIWRNVKLINEILEVQEYLDGKNINKKCLYRTCFMLAKWYKQQGLSNVEIREKIFEWGKKYNIYIKYNVNSIIYQALEDKHRLRGDEAVVRISQSDIDEITRRFDSVPCRKTALGILCYAKVSADRDNEFNISALALSNWLHLYSSNMSSRYIKEMIDFEYIQKINSTVTYSWDKNVKSNSLNLKILVPIENKGEHILVDNDIEGLFDEIFQK